MSLYVTGGGKVEGSSGGVGANTALSNLTLTQINQSLVPGADNTINLGSVSFRWSTLYITSLIGAAGNSITLNSGTSSIDLAAASGGVNVSHGLNLKGSVSGAISHLAAATTTPYSVTWPSAQGTGALLNNGSGAFSWSGSSPVSSISIASANGFAGSSSGGATPALTISTTITGILQGNGTAISAASTTGSGNVVLATSPSLVTPDLGSTQIHSVADPSSAQDAATKAYVDAGLAALNPAAAVFAASVANIAGTYNNGTAGVGATFTTTATTAFALDGTSPAVGARVLLKDQSTGFQSGIYTLTTQAVGGVSGAVLTRATDYNTPADMNTAGLIPVQNGTVNALSSWQQIAIITTIGTDALSFTEFTANPSLYLLKANNLNDVASSSVAFNNLSGLTTLGDLIYGGASGTRSRLAGSISATKMFLTQTGNGSISAAPAWGTIAAGDVPTLNQNTSGTAAGLSGNQTANTVYAGPSSGGASTASFRSQVYADISPALKAPTVQTFTAAPTGATNYTFTITSHAFIKGDTYTNNGATFTVLSASATSTTVIMSGTNTPAASGTLTWASGGGSGNITFSAFTGAYVTPTSPAPLYIRVRMAGGGGGGGQSGTSGGTNAVAGTATTFGSSLLTANGGGACVFPGAATAGGTATISAPAYGTAITGGTGAGPIKVTASGVYALGSPGGSTPHFGGGAPVSDFNTLTGIAGVTNTGGGGSGAGIAIINGIAGGGGGSGGFVDAIIPSPSSLYTCTVGGAGSGGLAGASGFGGAAGAAGIIEVTEYYQ